MRFRGLVSFGAATIMLLTACGGAATPAASSPSPASPAAKAAAPSSAAVKPAAGSSAAAKPAAAASASAQAGAPAVNKQGPSFTFKFASPSPEADLSGVGYKHWAQLVSDRTGGRIKFQFFWAGSLLSSTQMFQGLRDGLADFAAPATSYVSGQVPDVASLEVPFGYPTDTELMLSFYREVEPVLSTIYGSQFSQQVVWASPATTADPVTCKNKFLDSPQAWQGALVRTAGKWQSATLQAWGAKPVTIDLGEAYSAIQRGTADCLLLVYNLLDSFKFYEVAHNLTRIDHSINFVTVNANASVWNKIPAADQQILKEAGEETQQFIMDERAKLVTTTIDKFKQQGMKVCTPSQQELARLRSATDPVLAEISKLQTDKGHQIQTIAKSYRDKVTKWGPTEGDMTPCPGA